MRLSTHKIISTCPISYIFLSNFEEDSAMDSQEPPTWANTYKQSHKVAGHVFCDNSLLDKVGVNIQLYKASLEGAKLQIYFITPNSP